MLFRPVDSQRQDDDVPLGRFIENVTKQGNEGVFVCFFAACRHLKEATHRPWDKSRLQALATAPVSGAHVTLLGCAMGQPMRDIDIQNSFLGDLARSLRPGTILRVMAQNIIQIQESDSSQKGVLHLSPCLGGL